MKFTQREYELLIYLLELGNWVVDANADRDDNDLEPFQMVAQKIMQMAVDDGHADLVELSEGKWLPSEAIDSALGEAITECLEDTFWPGLARRLALRDLERERRGLPETLDDEDLDLWMSHEMGWREEFSEYGIERLTVGPATVPVAGAMMPREIYELKIQLLGIHPPIWRRVRVPSDITLEDLHDVFQVVMGWEDCHLFSFLGHDGVYAPKEDVGPGQSFSLQTAVCQLISGEDSVMQYNYDFGDGWEHRVTLFKTHEWDAAASLPTCVAGRRACPPEDCGGVPGYYRLLEVLEDPQDEEHESIKEWLGGSFDPDQFSKEAVNTALATEFQDY